MNYEDIQLSVNQRLKEFERLHQGDKAVVTSDGYWVLYPDGAKRETSPYGSLHEPPKDEIQLLQAKHLFHKRVLQIATNKFNENKTNMLGGIYSPEALKQLEQLRQQVLQTRDMITKIEEEYENHPTIVGKRNSQAERQQQLTEAIQAVRDIKI